MVPSDVVWRRRTTSRDVTQGLQLSTNQRPRNYLRQTGRQTDRTTQNQHTVRPCSTSSACKNMSFEGAGLKFMQYPRYYTSAKCAQTFQVAPNMQHAVQRRGPVHQYDQSGNNERLLPHPNTKLPSSVSLETSRSSC